MSRNGGGSRSGRDGGGDGRGGGFGGRRGGERNGGLDRAGAGRDGGFGGGNGRSGGFGGAGRNSGSDRGVERIGGLDGGFNNGGSNNGQTATIIVPAQTSISTPDPAPSTIPSPTPTEVATVDVTPSSLPPPEETLEPFPSTFRGSAVTVTVRTTFPQSQVTPSATISFSTYTYATDVSGSTDSQLPPVSAPTPTVVRNGVPAVAANSESTRVTVIGLATGGAVFGLALIFFLLYFFFRRRYSRTKRPLLPYGGDTIPHKPSAAKLLFASSLLSTSSFGKSRARSSAAPPEQVPPSLKTQDDQSEYETASVDSLTVGFLEPVREDDWEKQHRYHIPRASYDSGNRQSAFGMDHLAAV